MTKVLTTCFRGFLGRSLSSFLSSAAQRNLFEEEYSNGTNDHDHQGNEEDIMDTRSQADLHGLDDLIEHRHCRRTLMHGLSQELRRSGLHCRELFDRMWQRIVKCGQIGRIQY